MFGCHFKLCGTDPGLCLYQQIIGPTVIPIATFVNDMTDIYRLNDCAGDLLELKSFAIVNKGCRFVNDSIVGNPSLTFFG